MAAWLGDRVMAKSRTFIHLIRASIKMSGCYEWLNFVPTHLIIFQTTSFWLKVTAIEDNCWLHALPHFPEPFVFCKLCTMHKKQPPLDHLNFPSPCTTWSQRSFHDAKLIFNLPSSLTVLFNLFFHLSTTHSLLSNAFVLVLVVFPTSQGGWCLSAWERFFATFSAFSVPSSHPVTHLAHTHTHHPHCTHWFASSHRESHSDQNLRLLCREYYE